MSERDTIDVGAQLRHLRAQVDAHSRPVRAARAVTTARRRRAAGTVGVVAAVLVVIVGVLSWPLPHRSTPVPVTASPSIGSPTDPAPARLTAERLGAATAGWAESWQPGAPPVTTDLPCADENLVEPGSVVVANEYRSGRTRGASHTVTAYSDSVIAMPTFGVIHASVNTCSIVRSDRLWYEFNEDDPDPDAKGFAEAAVLSWRDGSSEGTVWLALSGNKISVLSVVGVTDPPEPVAERIAEAVVADMLAR